nr:hypothetical protein [Paenibacillus algorifonticola]
METILSFVAFAVVMVLSIFI